jgi:hypothetical protein
MLEHVVEYMARAMEEHKSKIKIANLPFVVAGGSSMPKGFLTLFARILKENPLPIPVGKLWQAKNPVMSVCKGCLIAAQKDLVKSTYDGVKDISDGDNKKHQYPQSFKEITEEIDKAKEEKTVLKAGAIADTQKSDKIKADKSDKSNKEIREDKIKGQAMSQGLGLAQAIDLGSF